MRSVSRVALIAFVALAGCALTEPPLPPPPSEADARAFLDVLIDKAEAGDLEGFCSVAGSVCDEIAEESGGVAAIPNEPPTVAGTRLVPPRDAGNGGTFAGGRLVVLCGTNGLGKPYRTEMLVSAGPDRVLYAINGVYWSGFDLAVAADTGSASGGAGIECPDPG
jgi:hypothetical protein